MLLLVRPDPSWEWALFGGQEEAESRRRRGIRENGGNYVFFVVFFVREGMAWRGGILGQSTDFWAGHNFCVFLCILCNTHRV